MAEIRDLAREPIELADDVARLTMPVDADIDLVYRWCQDPAMKLTTIPWPYTRDHAVDYVTRILPEGWTQGVFAWIVRRAADIPDPVTGQAPAVGSVGITIKDGGDGYRSGEVGWATAPWARGEGLALAAMRQVLTWAFAEFDLTRALWKAEVGNWASRRLAWKLGFRVEGAIRAEYMVRGNPTDAWIGTLLPGEPLQPNEPWVGEPR